MTKTSAAYAIAFLAFFTISYVVVYDLWAHFYGHPTISNQLARWLRESIAGPIMVAIWVGLPVGLFYHLLQQKLLK